jgi:aldehyde dehydrogenase (NAD+)
MQESLKKLGLKLKNAGTSTGLNTMNGRKFLESYSPVDGSLIGQVCDY